MNEDIVQTVENYLKNVNLDLYKNIFIEALGIEEKSFSEEIKYNEIPEWTNRPHDFSFCT